MFAVHIKLLLMELKIIGSFCTLFNTVVSITVPSQQVYKITLNMFTARHNI